MMFDSLRSTINMETLISRMASRIIMMIRFFFCPGSLARFSLDDIMKVQLPLLLGPMAHHNQCPRPSGRIPFC